MRQFKHFVYFLAITSTVALSGCQTQTANPDPTRSNFTLGQAQRSLQKGMSQSEVIEALGSPNMVTRDRNGVETWVYDKSSMEVVASSNSVMGTVLLLTGQSSSQSARTAQRTLTIILKFKNSVLSDFSYNSTSF